MNSSSPPSTARAQVEMLALSHVVVWVERNKRWTVVLFGGTELGEWPDHDHDHDLDLLQQIEIEYLEQLGSDATSSHLFGCETRADHN